MLRMTTNRKGWLDNNGSDTSRSLMSGLSLSPQANFTIASKLKEKLRKAREALATKKSNPESLQTEQTQIERTIIKEKSGGDSDDENLRIPLDIHRAEGFTEKYGIFSVWNRINSLDEQNELQRKARQTAAMLKKTIKKRVLIFLLLEKNICSGTCRKEREFS